jgi:hypothetical protein
MSCVLNSGTLAKYEVKEMMVALGYRLDPPPPSPGSLTTRLTTSDQRR